MAEIKKRGRKAMSDSTSVVKDNSSKEKKEKKKLSPEEVKARMEKYDKNLQESIHNEVVQNEDIRKLVRTARSNIRLIKEVGTRSNKSIEEDIRITCEILSKVISTGRSEANLLNNEYKYNKDTKTGINKNRYYKIKSIIENLEYKTVYPDSSITNSTTNSTNNSTP